jgi:hypothetical protein
MAELGPAWFALLTALHETFRSADLADVQSEIDDMQAAIAASVDAYVKKKYHESAEIAAKDAATNQAKEMASMLQGCKCSTGACSHCLCSKKGKGPGFCTSACGCKENCSISKYKKKKALEELMEEAATKARAKVLRKAKEKKVKAARRRKGEPSESEASTESESEEESESDSESEKKKKKKSKKKSKKKDDSDSE